MKTALALVALACALVLPLSSCVGPRVDVPALFGPGQLAWPDVRSDLEAGLDDGTSEGDLTIPAADALRAEADKLEAALAAEEALGE